jgi:hypothetical protein
MIRHRKTATYARIGVTLLGAIVAFSTVWCERTGAQENWPSQATSPKEDNSYFYHTPFGNIGEIRQVDTPFAYFFLNPNAAAQYKTYPELLTQMIKDRECYLFEKGHKFIPLETMNVPRLR